MSVELYYFPWSHWSRVVSLALAEKGLFERATRRVVDIRHNLNFSPDYLRINPNVSSALPPTLPASKFDRRLKPTKMQLHLVLVFKKNYSLSCILFLPLWPRFFCTGIVTPMAS